MEAVTVKMVLSLLSVLWLVTLSLFAYIIKVKDKETDLIKSSIEDLKDIYVQLNMNSISSSKDLANIDYTTKQLSAKIEKHNELIVNLLTSHTNISTKQTDLERRIDILEKIVHKK